MDIEPEQQIPSTVEFTMHAETLPSTMEMNAESTMDHTAKGMIQHHLWMCRPQMRKL